jgi:hypothetical protein
MVKEKIIFLKRNILLIIVQFLYNININSSLIFFSGLYFFILAITMLLGAWTFYGLTSHIFFFIIYLFFLMLLIRQIIKKFKYSNRAKIVFWLEKKNYEAINPLSALNDKPVNKNYNQAIWILHKKSTLQNLKNIKFYFPHLNFNSTDPLKTRFIVLVFFFLSMFWGIQNEKINKNIVGFFNYNSYAISNDYFFVQAWLKPPEYTNLELTNYKVSDKNNNEVNKEIVPINSELNIIIKSNNKNFSILSNDKEIPVVRKEKNNYHINYNIKDNQNIIIKKSKDYYKKWSFKVLPDKPPIIEFLSKPIIVNQTAITFLAKASDDYGIKLLRANISRPLEYGHFKEEYLSYNLKLDTEVSGTNKSIESYFYERLSHMIWAGSESVLTLMASDSSGQIIKKLENIIIPKKEFRDALANEIINIRADIAKKKVTLEAAKEKLSLIRNKNEYLQKDFYAKKILSEVFDNMNQKENFSISNKLFIKMYELAKIIEEGKTYLAKKNLEQIEQNLFDSIKEKQSDKISTNINKLKESIESLFKLDEENSKSKTEFNKKVNNSLRNEINKLTQQIEDLLKTGSKKKANEKIRKLQQLTERIKNPNRNKDAMQKAQKREEFINKLSELLNEQEKVMEETFNRAANKGKFEQSSQGSGGKSSKEKQEELRNTLGNLMRDIGASESEIPQELGKADRAMRQASRDLEGGRPDNASNAQGRALEMIQRSINKINSEQILKNGQLAKAGNQSNEEIAQKDYLADKENMEYQGTSAGGKLEIPQERKLQTAKKIADELYNRYNQENRSLKDKMYIKNLLDWY